MRGSGAETTRSSRRGRAVDGLAARGHHDCSISWNLGFMIMSVRSALARGQALLAGRAAGDRTLAPRGIGTARPVTGGHMFRNTMPRYEILSEEAMAVLDSGWRRLVSEIGVEFLSDRALDLFRAAGPEGRGPERHARSRLRARAGGQGPAGVRRPGPQPGELCAHRWRHDGLLRRVRAAVRARGRGAPGRHAGRLPQLRPPGPVVQRARQRRGCDLRAERRTRWTAATST